MDKLAKWLEAAGLSAFAVLAPIHNMLLATGVMIFADLITGIWASMKRNETITSAALGRTLTKIFVYELALILAFLAEHYMSDILPFIKMASAMITLVEMKSIYENLNYISGSQIFKALLDKLSSANLNQDK